jgi:hypothetical protein
MWEYYLGVDYLERLVEREAVADLFDLGWRILFDGAGLRDQVVPSLLCDV